MEFEFDPAKSGANEKKHGLDFEAAQELWHDLDALAGPANSSTEPRRMLIAQRAGRMWTVIYTMRGDKARIISVRPSRTEEREAYENQDENDGEES